MKNKSSIIIPAALLFLSMFSCANDQETKQTPLQKFSVANPEVRDIVYRLEYPGYLQSERIVEIIARTEGFLIENKIKPGQKVSEGDVLFIIEPKTYEDKLTTAEAALATAKSNLVFAQSSLDRIEEAAKSNAVSQIDLIQAQTNVDLCKSAIKTAEAQLSIAQTQLGYCYIKAPCNGRVSKSTVDEGNYVKPQTQLTTLYKEDNMYAIFTIEASNLIWAQKQAKSQGSINTKPFNTVDVIVADVTGETEIFQGELDYLSPSADLSTGTVDMRAVIKNPKNELNNGVYVKISLPYKEAKDAVLVPESSIGSDQSGRYIYVVKDDTVRYRNVKVGQLERDNMREITLGLQADELYITEALTRVRNGQAINPVLESTKQK